MKLLKRILAAIVIAFALIGFGLVAGYFAVRFGVTNTAGVIDSQRNVFLSGDVSIKSLWERTSPPEYSDDSWKNTEEWLVFKEAVLKDQEALTKAANKADIEPRLIMSMLAVEQLRLFFSVREVYKQVFAPLKILGVQSQFSWGVMGIKQETAKNIEENLTDPLSPFYPGKTYEHLLDFSTTDTDKERFERLTDQHERYYSYLYTALYLREIETQWKNAGYDISEYPEILATLYNIGFIHSEPKQSPQVGGAEIEIGSKTYSFGALAANIYYSDELIEAFSR